MIHCHGYYQREITLPKKSLPLRVPPSARLADYNSTPEKQQERHFSAGLRRPGMRAAVSGDRIEPALLGRCKFTSKSILVLTIGLIPPVWGNA